MCVCVYIHTYIYTYMHTYIHMSIRVCEKAKEAGSFHSRHALISVILSRLNVSAGLWQPPKHSSGLFAFSWPLLRRSSPFALSLFFRSFLLLFSLSLSLALAFVFSSCVLAQLPVFNLHAGLFSSSASVLCICRAYLCASRTAFDGLLSVCRPAGRHGLLRLIFLLKARHKSKTPCCSSDVARRMEITYS